MPKRYDALEKKSFASVPPRAPSPSFGQLPEGPARFDARELVKYVRRSSGEPTSEGVPVGACPSYQTPNPTLFLLDGFDVSYKMTNPNSYLALILHFLPREI
jgi:hypothetical protein